MTGVSTPAPNRCWCKAGPGRWHCALPEDLCKAGRSSGTVPAADDWGTAFNATFRSQYRGECGLSCRLAVEAHLDDRLSRVVQAGTFYDHECVVPLMSQEHKRNRSDRNSTRTYENPQHTEVKQRTTRGSQGPWDPSTSRRSTTVCTRSSMWLHFGLVQNSLKK